MQMFGRFGSILLMLGMLQITGDLAHMAAPTIACSRIAAGERGMPMIRTGRYSIQLPLPPLDGPVAPMRRDRSESGFQGQLMGARVELGIEVGEASIAYGEFASLKEAACNDAFDEVILGGTRVRLSRPNLIFETLDTQVVIYSPRRARQHQGGGALTGMQYCLGRVYLYGRMMMLYMISDTDIQSTLGLKMREWVDSVMKANPDGIDKSPTVGLVLPGQPANTFETPLPSAMMRFSDIGGRFGKPAFRFTSIDYADSEREDREQGNRGHDNSNDISRGTAAYLVLESPAALEELKRVSPGLDVLASPSFPAGPGGRSRDTILYSFSREGQPRYIHGALVRINDQILRFEFVVPAGDRKIHDDIEKRLESWIRETQEANRKGMGRQQWDRPHFAGPGMRP